MNSSTSENDIFLLIGALSVLCLEDNLELVAEENADLVQSHIDAEEEKEQQNTLSVKSFVKDKAIEMYAKKGFESVRKNLKSSEPLAIGNLDRERVKDTDIDVGFILRNVKLYNLSSFQVKKFKSRSEQSAAEFAMDVPSMRANADYEVDGTFKGKKVNGKGNGDINVTGVSIDDGKIVIKETPEEIQIQSISFVYDFKDLNVKQTGLHVEGMQEGEINSFLNTTGKKYLKDNRQKLSNKVAQEMKVRANQKLKGKNRDQLMEMYKKAT